MSNSASNSVSKSIYDIPVTDIHGKEQKLDQYKDKVLLIVNTASKCGFTPQYKGLEAVYKNMHARGLDVLGFPCNQFGAQEPGDANQIAAFCENRYDVTFPMFEKIEVNGFHVHPLFDHLKKAKSGLLGPSIKWNFTKFLVDRNGKVVARHAPTTTPQALRKEIEALL